jgi:hypothetical protein
LAQPSRRSLQRWRINRDRNAERRIRGVGSLGGALMFDVAAIAIAIACFAFIFILLYALERV